MGTAKFLELQILFKLLKYNYLLEAFDKSIAITNFILYNIIKTKIYMHWYLSWSKEVFMKFIIS